MAKTQLVSTKSPMLFGTGQGIFTEDAQVVCEMLNYAFGYEPEVYFSMVVAASAWGNSGFEVATHNIVFPTSSGVTDRFRTRMWIDPDIVTINLGATCTFPASNTGRVRFVIGGASAVDISFNNGTNGTEQTSSVATSSTGTGWQVYTIQIDHQTGASGSCYVEDIRIEGARRTSSLPDPVAE